MVIILPAVSQSEIDAIGTTEMPSFETKSVDITEYICVNVFDVVKNGQRVRN